MPRRQREGAQARWHGLPQGLHPRQRPRGILPRRRDHRLQAAVQPRGATAARCACCVRLATLAVLCVLCCVRCVRCVSWVHSLAALCCSPVELSARLCLPHASLAKTHTAAALPACTRTASCWAARRSARRAWSAAWTWWVCRGGHAAVRAALTLVLQSGLQWRSPAAVLDSGSRAA